MEENTETVEAMLDQKPKEPVKQYVSSFVKKQPTSKEGVTIVMPVSVGLSHCEGEELRSQLNLINLTFKNSKVIFVIASTLQRFTNQIYGLSDQEALRKSINDGLKWKSDHQQMIKDELTNAQSEFIDWEDLRNDEKFQEKVQFVQAHYSKGNGYKRKVDKTAAKFLDIRSEDEKIPEQINVEDILKFSKLYLLEECAGELFLADRGYNYVAYPRPISRALEATHEFFKEKKVFEYLTIQNKEVKFEFSQKEMIGGFLPQHRKTDLIYSKRANQTIFKPKKQSPPSSSSSSDEETQYKSKIVETVKDIWEDDALSPQRKAALLGSMFLSIEEGIKFNVVGGGKEQDVKKTAGNNLQKH